MTHDVPSLSRTPRLHALVAAYYELVAEFPAEITHELCTLASSIADVDVWFALCRAVRDPFAWQPFLRQLHNVPQVRRTTRSEGARHRLHALAAELLRRQGLGLVRPEDLLARPTPFEEAFTSLTRNED